jgi:hypothetical protein
MLGAEVAAPVAPGERRAFGPDLGSLRFVPVDGGLLVGRSANT